MVRVVLCAVLAALAAVAPAAAHPGERGKGALRFGADEISERLAFKRAAAAQAQEPPIAASPRAECGPGARPETGIQGRVPDGAAEGFACNLEAIGRQGTAGGYKVLRYVDKAGHECAYYDSTLLFPNNARTLSEQPTGVAVLDMADPTRPRFTTSLLTPAMQSPHESLVLNEKRGLLAAVLGNPAFAPGVVDLYDISQDCREPVLRSSLPVGLLGHESGFAEDGNTFYATSISTGQVTVVDVTDPRAPRPLGVAPYNSHGLTLSDDGNRAYLADSSGLIILDVSDFQARRADPEFREVSRLSWSNITIPQIAHPVTIGGRPYLVEVDEFSSEADGGGVTANGPRVGAGRIIDIADERRPRVVSNFRLAVHQPENREALANDPAVGSPVQGYAGHYCNVPRRAEPGIVACSMIGSGLRVFDIRDPTRPREIAYYVAPLEAPATMGRPSNYAMSSPTFVPARREIWYSDGNSGFYALRMAEGVWEAAGTSATCTDGAGLAAVSLTGRRLSASKRVDLPVRVDVFRTSAGRRVIRERRVARGTRLPRRLADGDYFARFTMLRGGRRFDRRRIAFRVRRGRIARRPDHHRRESCGTLRSFKLERPAFGGTNRVPLRIAYSLATPARVTVTVRRGRRVVKRFTSTGRRVRLALPARRLGRGDHRVTLRGAGVEATLVSRRL